MTKVDKEQQLVSFIRWCPSTLSLQPHRELLLKSKTSCQDVCLSLLFPAVFALLLDLVVLVLLLLLMALLLLLEHALPPTPARLGC